MEPLREEHAEANESGSGIWILTTCPFLFSLGDQERDLLRGFPHLSLDLLPECEWEPGSDLGLDLTFARRPRSERLFEVLQDLQQLLLRRLLKRSSSRP